MAEMEMTPANKRTGKKQHKKSTRVDLTPMVDLGFLLLTFFVFTTTMARPSAMDIVQPADGGEPTTIAASCVLTVILDKNDRIMYYEGLPENHPVIKETTFNADGLRRLLLDKKAAVQKATGTANEMVLIVKMTDESNYKNFVDVVDEVQITGVKHYFIADMDAADKSLVKK